LDNEFEVRVRLPSLPSLPSGNGTGQEPYVSGLDAETLKRSSVLNATEEAGSIGKCSTCSATFTDGQDFYKHLGDCVPQVSQPEELSESINIGLTSSKTAAFDLVLQWTTLSREDI